MERKNNSNLQELILKDKIIGRRCDECQQIITEQNYKDKNFTLWFDVEEFDWQEAEDRHKLTLNIHAITHEKTSFYDCPTVEECWSCSKKVLAAETKRGLMDDDNYYCFPCFNKKYGDYLAERSKPKELKAEQKEIMRLINQAINEHLESNYHRGEIDYKTCQGSKCEGYKQTLESYGIK